MSFSRRRFLASSLGSLGLLAGRRVLAGGASGALVPLTTNAPHVIKPHDRIKHVIVAMMENRSFDHFLGWLPGAEGMQAGLTYYDANGVPYSTFPLAPDYQGCGYRGPDNSYSGGRVEYDGGACDGWLLANDQFSIGYYTQNDLPFLGTAAPQWTVCDNYFSAIMGPTFPNRMYLHCGVTDRLDDSLTPSTLPTIWDLLASRGISRRYYFSDLPFLSLWGFKYADITFPFAQVLADCASGELPSVSYVDPPTLGENEGFSSDDHPPGDIRAGEYWMSQLYRAVTTSPAWRHTALVITFDEWGGFFDHVAPATAPDVDPAFALRGFRVPCVVISPYARRGYVSNTVFDHTSVLKMIESRFGLPALSVRDANANDLMSVLDLGTQDLGAPQWPVASAVSTGCLF